MLKFLIAALVAIGVGLVRWLSNPTQAFAAGLMHQALIDSVHVEMVLAPVSKHNTTQATKFMDTLDYEYGEFHLLIGVASDVVDCKLQESVNADGSSASDVTGGAITERAANAVANEVAITFRKTALTKRYVGLLFTVDGTGSAAVIAANGLMWGREGAGNMPEALQAAVTNHIQTTEVIRVS